MTEYKFQTPVLAFHHPVPADATPRWDPFLSPCKDMQRWICLSAEILHTSLQRGYAGYIIGLIRSSLFHAPFSHPIPQTLVAEARTGCRRNGIQKEQP
jgi:hypothetical protein